jgi:cytochrome c553
LPQGAPEIDDQSFSNEDQTVGAGETAPLGPGLLILTDWSAGAQMKIEFTTLAAATVVDSGTLAGGCKALSTFTANAVPAIQANTCLTCHNSGGSGNAAMDLSGLAATPPDDATACAQALAQVNLTTPAQSNIILAPTGGLTNHPFTKASQSFVTMMETWIAAEQ